MNLVFNEYIKFLNDKGLEEQTNIKLKEGYYWQDRSIIKAYDKQGDIHKIVRMKITDELKIDFKTYDDCKFEIESWNETVTRNKNKLLNLESESLSLINKSINKFDNYIVSIPYSSGKDSTVVKYLVEKTYDNPLILFNNTTCDVADTYKFIKKIPNVKIITPKEGIYQWIKRMNFIQTRMSRACCDIFKEQPMVDYLDRDKNYLLFLGMRNQESNTRSNYNDYWNNDKWSNKWNGVLPIRKWTEEDIWLYILMNNIEFNPKYKLGYTRVGCGIICPYYTKSTWVLDQYWYPYLYNRFHNILEEDFIKNKKASTMNCTLKEYHLAWNGGRVRDNANYEIIKEFSEQQNLTYEIAEKYFNKKCCCCNKTLKKNDIALSMKYYGRHINRFKCMKCLSEDLGVTQKVLKEKIKDFKQMGCNLF